LSALSRGALLGLGLLVVAGPSAAAESGAAPDVDPATMARFRRLDWEPGGAAQLAAALFFGRGLRFNNPYRLSTQLGDTAESLSLTATST
jgi:hypothetical protein